MSNQWQARRGTTAQNDAFTGASGEITYDTESQGLRVHDGTKQGGYLVDTVVDFQKPTAENNYTWYRLYASGFVEQGGLLGDAGSFATRIINMPVEMADVNYTVVITGAWSDSSGNGSTLLNSKTTTTFATYATNVNNYGSWQVSGMAA